MEQSILASLTKSVPKTRLTNIKVPTGIHKQDKVSAFASTVEGKDISLLEKLTKCTISENEIAKLITEINESAIKAPKNIDYETCIRFFSDLEIPTTQANQFYYLTVLLK